MPEVAATPAFVMYAAREAVASGLGHVGEQIKSIERAVVENPGLAFDLAKTLIESLPTARLEYTDHPDFNAYLDDSNEPVRIFDLQYAPSEVLFQIDADAYRDLLANYEPQDVEADAANVPLEPAEAVE